MTFKPPTERFLRGPFAATIRRMPGAVAGGVLAAAIAVLVGTPSPAALDPLALAGWLLFAVLAVAVLLDRLFRSVAAAETAQAREARRDAELCLDTIMHSLPDALVVVDDQARIRAFNPAAVRMFGYSSSETQDEPADGLLANPYAHRFRQALKEFVADGTGPLFDGRREAMARRKDSTVFPVELSVAPMNRDGDRRFLVVVHDISARKRVLARLDVAEKVLESTMEGVMVTDRRGIMLWVNQSFCRISGYGREEVLGKPAGMLKSGLQDPTFYASMWDTIRDQGAWAGEIWNRRKDGEAFPEWLTIKAITDPAGQVTRYVGVFSDISHHKRAEETIRTLTYYDAVTRLPNRYLFMDRLAQAIERSQRSQRKAALVMVGLDRFRQINESLGHQNGDTLLRAVADRMAASLRGHDTVARLRGDTFCCLLTELIQGHDAHVVISRLLDCFATSFVVEGQEVFVTAAVGISVFPGDGTDPEELVRKAETAMNRSKDQADNSFQYFAPEMHATSAVRLRLETELRKAVARDEFSVHYQPKIDAATGRLVGAEALLRWHHAELGMISPADFIPIAEDTGLIVPIGDWVLKHVCGQIRRWQDQGTPVVQVAVNISAHQFRQPDLVDKVVQALAHHSVDPALIELELTESAVMRNAETAISTLLALHNQGVHLAVDDFGTGYSSLSYLKKFPLDKLKIDRSFVLDLATNPASVEIVGAIVAMAHSLNLSVVAEGVETEEQLTILRSLRCNEVQGFYYSRPIPADTFEGILRLGRLTGSQAAA